MEIVLSFPLYFLVLSGLVWILGFYWLVRDPDWIASLALALFFFMPAIVDLVLVGQTIPTGLIILFVLGPPLFVSLLLKGASVRYLDVALLTGFGICIVISIVVNGLPLWDVKSSFVPVFFSLLIYFSIDSRSALYRLLWVYIFLILVNTIFQGMQRSGFMWAYLPGQRELALAGGVTRGVGLSGHFAMAGLYASVVFPIAVTFYLSAKKS